MNVSIDYVLFEFDSLCANCGWNQNDDESDTSVQSILTDILKHGRPVCASCGEELTIYPECEVIF